MLAEKLCWRLMPTPEWYYNVLPLTEKSSKLQHSKLQRSSRIQLNSDSIPTHIHHRFQSFGFEISLELGAKDLELFRSSIP
jgi:hypothetical protein